MLQHNLTKCKETLNHLQHNLYTTKVNKSMIRKNTTYILNCFDHSELRDIITKSKWKTKLQENIHSTKLKTYNQNLDKTNTNSTNNYVKRFKEHFCCNVILL